MRPLRGLQVIVTCFRRDEGTILSSLLPYHRDEKVPTATCCYHTALPQRLRSNHTNRLKTGNPKTVTFALHVSITLSIFHHDRKLAKSALEIKPCSHFRSKESITEVLHVYIHSTNTCVLILCQPQGLGKRDMELSQLETPIMPCELLYSSATCRHCQNFLCCCGSF